MWSKGGGQKCRMPRSSESYSNLPKRTAARNPIAMGGGRAKPTGAEPGPAREAGPTLGPCELINVRLLTG